MSKGIERNKKITFRAEKADDTDRMVILGGTVIHLNGIPFRLERDTWVRGYKVNMKMAKEGGI